MVRHLLLCSWLFALCPSLTAAEVYQGKARPVISRIELTDGRVLEQAQILGDSAYTVTVKHGRTVEKISKELLPPDLAAQWPVDRAKAAREEYDAQQAAARREAERKKGAKIAERVRKEQIREAQDSLKRNAKLDEQRAKDEKKRAEELAERRTVMEQLRARSRDELFLGGFGRMAGPDGVRVTVRNVGDSDRRLDWRQLRALTADGAIVPAADVVFALKERASYDLATGESRAFRLDFKRHDIVALGWADREDLGWSNADGARVEAAQAIAAERERRAAARLEERRSKLRPVEGLPLVVK